MKSAIVFSVTLSQLIANAITSMSDMCSDFGGDLNDLDSARTNWNVAKNIVDDLLSADHDRITSEFRDGVTMMMLPADVMNGIEKLTEKDRNAKFYVEVLVPGEKTPIVIHSNDVKW